MKFQEKDQNLKKLGKNLLRYVKSHIFELKINFIFSSLLDMEKLRKTGGKIRKEKNQ